MNAKTNLAAGAAQIENREQGSRTFTQAVDGLKDGINAATRGLQQAQASVKQGMEKAMNNAEEMLAFGQGNVEAAMQSGQILTSGLQDLSRQTAATVQTRIDETLSATRALFGAKSLREVFDLQSSYGRSNLERSFSESSKLAEASFKLMEQAWAPITQRVTHAMERFSTTAA